MTTKIWNRSLTRNTLGRTAPSVQALYHILHDKLAGSRVWCKIDLPRSAIHPAISPVRIVYQKLVPHRGTSNPGALDTLPYEDQYEREQRRKTNLENSDQNSASLQQVVFPQQQPKLGQPTTHSSVLPQLLQHKWNTPIAAIRNDINRYKCSKCITHFRN